MHQPTVLIVDDEPAIRDMLRMALEMAAFSCLEADNSQQAYRLAVDQRPALLLLDWMLPGGSGLELLRRLRRNPATDDLPVIMLTAKTTEDNIVQGLSLADDYMSKPFAPRELIARMRALLRRSGSDGAALLQVAELCLHGASRRVFLAGEQLAMGPTEFRLLQFFMSHPERACSRGQLLDRVWGAAADMEERTVDVHIRRLRCALQTGTHDYSHLIETVRGTGYRFSPRGVAAR